MSTRDERRRGRRLATAAGIHWLKAAADIDERLYLAMRAEDLPGGQGHVPSDERHCGQCGAAVMIDKRLIALAERSKGIICNHCAAKGKKLPLENLILNQLNRDIGEEL